MSLVGRLSWGIALAVLPLVAVIGLLVGLLDEMVAANARVVDNQARGAEHATAIRWRSAPLEASLGKYFVSGDLAYWEDAFEEARRIDAEIDALATLDLDGEERRAFLALRDTWRAFREGPGSDDLGASDGPEELHTLEEVLDEVRLRSEALDHASRAAMASQARHAAGRSASAARWSTWIALAALSASLGVFLFTFRLVKRPLEGLLEGTRRVAAGDLAVRIATPSRDELGQLSRAFDAMVAQLAQLEEAKSTFVSHVSHELRTPLVGIIETNALLLDEVVGPLGARQRRMLELNQGSARRLSTMIGELLELSTLSARLRYAFARRDLGVIAHRVVATMEARFAQAGVGLTFEPPPDPVVVLVDEDRMVQVITNLLDNALKVTPRGGDVSVRVGRAQGTDLPGAVSPEAARRAFGLVVVEDTGPGLDDDDSRRIFERFARGRHGPRGSSAGFGLGLAICREIVDAHQGLVHAGPRQGAPGARFAVAIPLAGPVSGHGRVAPSSITIVALVVMALGGGCGRSGGEAARPVEARWSAGDIAGTLREHDRAAARATSPGGRAMALLAGALAALAVDPDDRADRARVRLEGARRVAPDAPGGAQAAALLVLLDARRELARALERSALRLAEAERAVVRAERRAELMEIELDALAISVASQDEERRRGAAELQETRARSKDLAAEVARLRQELAALKRIDLRRRP